VIFIAFSGEEWGLKGSQHFVQSLGDAPGERVLSMVNLDSVGRLAGKPVTVFGTNTAVDWQYIPMFASLQTGVDSKGVPEDPGGSDQMSFTAVGIPAVHVFAGMHDDYHRPTDTADRVDVAGLVNVTAFVEEVISHLANREEPLMTNAPAGDAPPAGGGGPPGDRRVSLGTRPDFEHTGPGYRASAITPGSPAEEAGLQAGDVLLATDGVEIEGVRGFSNLLKERAPGDVVTIRYRRGDEELETKATLRTR